MEELRGRFPQDIDYAIVYDTTPFIQESIDEVFKTLRDAVILVAIVMLVFLQSWRAAIIPLAAVPVAIVGTFAAMSVLGYSVNNLTLFGLVLAVGIVVDDAIVVVEAVQHHIENGLSPRDATMLAMDQVSGPVIAVGLVLAAVFVPCVFISGIVGEFYRQFAVTIAVSTLLSAFNSLTLSPALCALLLKPPAEGEKAEPLPRIAFPLAGAALAYWLLSAHLRQWFAGVNFPGWFVPVVAAFAGGLVGWTLRVVPEPHTRPPVHRLQHRVRHRHEGLPRRGRRGAAALAHRAPRLRRTALPDVLHDHDDSERLHSAAGQGLSARERRAPRRGVARPNRGADAPTRTRCARRRPA